MRYEHEEGRKLIAAMASAVERAAIGGPSASPDFARAARGYVSLLRQHIQKEDHCLFPMAEQLLSAAEAEALFQSFEQVEHADMGDGTHEKYLKLADALADRLGVPRAQRSCAHGGACHHHHA
jgi:hemerythrin-like domain-containing protein